MNQTVRVRWPGKTAEHLFFLDFLFLFYQEKRKANHFEILSLLFFVEKKYPDSHRDLRQKKPPENDLQPVFGNALIKLQCYCDLS